MTTNNPKISAYVPQAVYDRFELFRQESGLSMSQSAIVIFAEYFGLEDIVKGITGETTTDNSALDRIKVLESQVSDLFKKISELESESVGELFSSVEVEPQVKETSDTPSEDIPSEPLNELPIQKGDTPSLSLDGLQGELLCELQIQVPSIPDVLLAKRLLTGKGKPIGTSNFRAKRKRISVEDFFAWTTQSDPDGIGWKCDEKTGLFTPNGDLSGEPKSKLLQWIQENS